MDDREYGLTLQLELEMGGEFPFRAAQCWLEPGATGQKRSVCEILNFRREKDWDREVLLTWEGPGSHLQQLGDVVRSQEGSNSPREHLGAGLDYDIPTSPLLSSWFTLLRTGTMGNIRAER